MSQTNRRKFLTQLVAASAAGVALGARAQPGAAPRAVATSSLPGELPSKPAGVWVQHEGTVLEAAPEVAPGRHASTGAEITLSPGAAGLAISVHCPKRPLARVLVRWSARCAPDILFLGDAWERGYGDLQWRFVQPERVLPWYFAAHDERTRTTFAAGVMTQPATFCLWTVDSEGISLWLDFRNGGEPGLPGDRVIAAATVVTLAAVDETPLAVLRRLCRKLCPAPRLAPAPVCGNNNWYYAYGVDFDADAMRRDATFLAEISSGHANRPYCVIDAGWTSGGVCPGGPWISGEAPRFPDMPGLAADMRRIGVRPGIWMRPTALSVVDDPRRLRAGPMRDPEKPLDLTLADNLAIIREEIARVRGWGYDLIKHDFSTYDLFARWGFQMGGDLTDPGWHFADRTLTNAEIILRLNRTLREAAGDAILLGCNTVGHLAAGFFEVQRTGDDTSGKMWERTRRMGVNTLAFRLPQHDTFFASDADCVPQTPRTPWAQNRQFLDLVARSGTALFVSVDPRTVTADQKAEFRRAMLTALSGGAPGGAEPLDWLRTTAPRRWKISGEEVVYSWEESTGAWPFKA